MVQQFFAQVHMQAQVQETASGGILQRSCDGCSKKKFWQRFVADPAPEMTPPIVHEVLRSPGSPLDSATRAFMESRFGHDFSRVRVHSEARAAESARAVNSLAYTVGAHIVFGAQHYQPGTDAGRRLLAHELTHTLQQPSQEDQPDPLQLGKASSQQEMEAQQAADRLSVPMTARPKPPAIQPGRPVLQRWAITGNIATSDSHSDTLGRLAQRAGGQFNDWKCIRPISMRTFSSGKGTTGQKERYERFVQIGDQFDISNLTATTGVSLLIHLFDTAEWKDALLSRSFYPGSVPSPNGDVDLDISNAAGDGKTPIQEFVIFGHAGGPEMWGGRVPHPFRPADFDPEDPEPSFAEADLGLFPRRCWFKRNAFARSIGCNSNAFGTDFAAAYLRKGASIVTTTASVRPSCQGLPLAIGTQLGVPGGCAWYNGLDFAAGHTIGATRLEGPFWSVADFHAARHWDTIAGKL